jgi:hypothetical protein
VKNTLAYYDTATIMTVKSVIVQAPGVLKVDSFLKNYAATEKLNTFKVARMPF